ncbi:MAG: Ribosomal RNA small subunit methyltransferase A, partial [Candidatus Nomurabacteria bacterium GW2011_GWA2_35_80]
MKPKKSLGQNFLKSISVLNRIVGAGEVSKDDIILEIGPGKGILTEKLLEKSNHVIAVEKDRELFYFLQNKFSKEIEEKKLILIKDDILKFDIQKMDCEFFGNYKIIANIPYNITGAILKKFLSEK